MPDNIGETIHNLFDSWNDHNPERIASFYSPHYEGEDVGEPGPQTGRAGIRSSVERYLKAFPDIHFEAEQMVIQEDRVAVIWTVTGTHQGTLMNIPPTGLKVKLRGMSLLTVSKQGITRGFYLWDLAGLLRSINLLPEL